MMALDEIKRLFVKCHGTPGVALKMSIRSHRLQDLNEIRMAIREPLRSYFMDFPQQSIGLRELLMGLVNQGELVKRDRVFQAEFSRQIALDSPRLLEEFSGARQILEGMVQPGQMVQAGGESRVLFTQQVPAPPLRLLQVFERLGIISQPLTDAAQRIKTVGVDGKAGFSKVLAQRRDFLCQGQGFEVPGLLQKFIQSLLQDLRPVQLLACRYGKTFQKLLMPGGEFPLPDSPACVILRSHKRPACGCLLAFSQLAVANRFMFFLVRKADGANQLKMGPQTVDELQKIRVRPTGFRGNAPVATKTFSRAG